MSDKLAEVMGWDLRIRTEVVVLRGGGGDYYLIHLDCYCYPVLPIVNCDNDTSYFE